MENLAIYVLFFTCFLLSPTATCLGNETDRLSLLAFKARISHDPLQVLASWNDSQHFCFWSGVTCGKKHQRVTRLNLPSLQLSGSLSPHVGNLSFLKVLNLQKNSFHGPIPPEVGRLFRLQILVLQINSFNGEIPRNISGCSNLLYLSLGSNLLVGALPDELSSLSKLTRLSLFNNSLVGQISPSLGNLSSLEIFDMTLNKIQGNIPNSFGKLHRLTMFYLGANNLSGQIPPSVYNLSSIRYFSVPVNQLQGSLPPDLGNRLPDIEILNLHTNQFDGQLPVSISNASKLSKISISSNHFSGTVPDLANLHDLQEMAVNENNLTNDDNDHHLNFLYGLLNCTKLEYLGISDNNFGGMLPEYISNFSVKLGKLTIARNHIRGKIPMEIGNLINLEALGMEINQLTGNIPSSIGKLQKLYSLFLNINELSGAVPSSIGNLSTLGRLNLRLNNLEGRIPPTLGQCNQLLEMSLSQNNLNGSIPKEVFSSSLFALDWSENQLTGSIPMEVGQLINLNYLKISNNKLSGEIPANLGNCIRLETLSLRGNLIQGTIPQSLSSLRGVQIIDFSQNNLSGKILNYFETFSVLEYLNLSFNNFEGELPTEGVYKNASKFLVTGNLKLCGGIPELNLPKCKSNELEKTVSRKLKLLIIIIVSAIGLISIFSVVALLICSRRKHNELVSNSFESFSLQLSYYDLFKATNGFDPSNLLGSGGFGSVYKAVLTEYEMVAAVKVFNLQYRSSFKSSKVECEAMRNIRHRNLVRLLTVCSSIDSQGNDFLALVYEFMENGSLEDWLNPTEGRKRSGSFNLMQRLNVAIGVATALQYLHNESHIKIVHCDLKPSNILLDGDMTAHVGDFGLARFINDTSHHFSSQTTSSIGLKGSIGYAAPEYGMEAVVSVHGDMYSYGILLLEMFTGKRPTDAMFKDGLDLHNFALRGLSEGTLSNVVDPTILQQIEEESCRNNTQQTHKVLVSIIETGVACSVRTPRDRKYISQVLAELSFIQRTHVENY